MQRAPYHQRRRGRVNFYRNQPLPSPDNPRMNWHDLDPAHSVLELPEAPGRDRLELELHVYWGEGGEPTRAVWLWSQTGRVAGWAVVGEA